MDWISSLVPTESANEAKHLLVHTTERSEGVVESPWGQQDATVDESGQKYRII
jgi:hypothetical protein